MKTFVPGEIARAEDVNANFSELKDASDQIGRASCRERVCLYV